jgi:hypothetical protein
LVSRVIQIAGSSDVAVQSFIDRRNLLRPTPALGVFQVQDRFVRPVEVIGDEGYLLVERLEGVA